MRKFICGLLIPISLVGCLCINAGATTATFSVVPACSQENDFNVMRASGSFNMSIGAYQKTAADKAFPLEAGETVRIYAVYSPDDASIDFGLLDSEDVFHFLTATTGVIDGTIEVPKRGNYTLAFKNNSGETVKVSGFVQY